MEYRWARRLVTAALLALGMAGAAAGGSTLQFLTPGQVQPAQLLPPPPDAGTPAAAAELNELRAIAKTTTAARWAQAQWDNDHENGTIFESAVPGLDLSQ